VSILYLISRATGAVIIIEDLDVLSPNVSRGDQRSGFAGILRREIDRIQSRDSKTIVLATTSNVDRVDPSLRSHVFSKEVELPVPDVTQRKDIIQKMIRKLNLNQLEEKYIIEIARCTHGFVGADLMSLLMETKLQHGHINEKNVFQCLKYVRPSALKSILIETPNVRLHLLFILILTLHSYNQKYYGLKYY